MWRYEGEDEAALKMPVCWRRLVHGTSLLRKTTGRNWIHSRQRPGGLQSAGHRAKAVQSTGEHIKIPHTWNVGHGVIGFSICSAGFDFALSNPFIYSPFLSFGIGMLTMCCYVLEMCNLFLSFTGTHS